VVTQLESEGDGASQQNKAADSGSLNPPIGNVDVLALSVLGATCDVFFSSGKLLKLSLLSSHHYELADATA
jgi:hypothetical protein